MLIITWVSGAFHLFEYILLPLAVPPCTFGFPDGTLPPLILQIAMSLSTQEQSDIPTKACWVFSQMGLFKKKI